MTNPLIFTFILILLVVKSTFSQSNYETGFRTSISATKNLKNNTEFGFSTETRPVLSEGVFRKSNFTGFRLELHQFAIELTKKIKKNTFGSTFVLRFRDNTTHYRNTFHYMHVIDFGKVNLSHRLMADQTYTNIDFPIFRFRYLIDLKVPFKEDKKAEKMFYGKVMYEYLSVIEAANYDFEIRFTPALGYQINPKATIEVGFESRAKNFIHKREPFKFEFWLNTGISISI